MSPQAWLTRHVHSLVERGDVDALEGVIYRLADKLSEEALRDLFEVEMAQADEPPDSGRPRDPGREDFHSDG
jgi:hypothetical protein